MRILGILLIVAALIGLHFLSTPEKAATADSRLQITAPKFVLTGIAFEISAVAKTGNGEIDRTCQSSILLRSPGQPADSAQPLRLNLENGQITIKNLASKHTGIQAFLIEFEGRTLTQAIRVLPGFLSLMPPLLAILLALVARQVMIALFTGIWFGATVIENYDPVFGFLRVVDTYLIQALNHPDHVAIVMFSMTLGGMVGVISRAGGTDGIVEKLTRFANHRRGGLLASWLLGIFIFFDDYANILIVGNTMRPFTDKLKISHEKLSYIVDSTAAPIAALFPISTWVGFQVALIAGAFEHLAIEQDAYLTFIESIPYSAYSVFAVLFVGISGLMLRDFGPMLHSESRAIVTGQLIREGAIPLADSSKLEVLAHNVPKRWYNALIPILSVILVTLFGLYISGRNALGSTEPVGLR